MSCLILFAEVGCRSFAPPLSITIYRGNEPLSWSQKNYIHGIEVAALVTQKSFNEVKRIISQHSSVGQLSFLVLSLGKGWVIVGLGICWVSVMRRLAPVR